MEQYSQMTSSHQMIEKFPERLKKHVAAIHTSGELSLLERKLSNVLLLNAYDNLPTERTHQIPLRALMLILGWNEGQNVAKLRAALKKLATTAIVFDVMGDDKEPWAVAPIISFGQIKGGICTYRYDEYLAEKFYDPAIYATVNLGVQRKFSGGHALTLYENCLRYLRVGSTGWWDLGTVRSILGATQEYYDDFRRLNSKVIQKAIKEINQVADIELTSEFQRSGRSVTAVRFLLKPSAQQSLLAPEAEDEFGHLRETELFRRLRDHGIGDKLALNFIIEDEERARQVVALVEDKDRKGQIKSSTAGLIRVLMETKADVGKTPYQVKKELEAQQEAERARRELSGARLQEARDDYMRELSKARIKGLSDEERRALAEQFIRTDGSLHADEFRASKPENNFFASSFARVTFSAWLHKQIRPAFDEAGFQEWLRNKASPL